MKYNYKISFPAFLIMLLFSSSLLSQNDEFGVIFWSKERELSWEDFKAKPLVDSTDNFFLDLYIQSTNISEMESYILIGSKPEAFIYANTSYVDEDIKNQDLLRYLNVYWDLAGYYSYKLTKTLEDIKDIDNATIRSNPQIISNSILEEWRTESARLAIETEYGQIIEKLISWEEELAQKVETIKNPKLHISDYAFGFDMQAGVLIALGNYNTYLTKSVAGVLAMEVTKAPWVFAIGISGGGQKVIQTFAEGENEFIENTQPNILNTYLHVGYKIFEDNNFRIIPRIGLHFSRLGYNQDSQNESKKIVTNLTTGITFDYKLFRWTARAYHSRSLTDISLRLGTYYYPMSIGDANISHGIISLGFSMTIGGGSLIYE